MNMNDKMQSKTNHAVNVRSIILCPLTIQSEVGDVRHGDMSERRHANAMIADNLSPGSNPIRSGSHLVDGPRLSSTIICQHERWRVGEGLSHRVSLTPHPGLNRYPSSKSIFYSPASVRIFPIDGIGRAMFITRAAFKAVFV